MAHIPVQETQETYINHLSYIEGTPIARMYSGTIPNAPADTRHLPYGLCGHENNPNLKPFPGYIHQNGVALGPPLPSSSPGGSAQT